MVPVERVVFSSLPGRYLFGVFCAVVSMGGCLAMPFRLLVCGLDALVLLRCRGSCEVAPSGVDVAFSGSKSLIGAKCLIYKAFFPNSAHSSTICRQKEGSPAVFLPALERKAEHLRGSL